MSNSIPHAMHACCTLMCNKVYRGSLLKGSDGRMEMGDKERQKKRKRELLDSEEVDEQTRLRLRWLTIEELEHDHKMRSIAIRLSQKRKKQADLWVILSSKHACMFSALGPDQVSVVALNVIPRKKRTRNRIRKIEFHLTPFTFFGINIGTFFLYSSYSLLNSLISSLSSFLEMR